jgi:hypothetical protein
MSGTQTSVKGSFSSKKSHLRREAMCITISKADRGRVVQAI